MNLLPTLIQRFNRTVVLIREDFSKKEYGEDLEKATRVVKRSRQKIIKHVIREEE